MHMCVSGVCVPHSHNEMGVRPYMGCNTTLEQPSGPFFQLVCVRLADRKSLSRLYCCSLWVAFVKVVATRIPAVTYTDDHLGFYSTVPNDNGILQPGPNPIGVPLCRQESHLRKYLPWSAYLHRR